MLTAWRVVAGRCGGSRSRKNRHISQPPLQHRSWRVPCNPSRLRPAPSPLVSPLPPPRGPLSAATRGKPHILIVAHATWGKPRRLIVACATWMCYVPPAILLMPPLPPAAAPSPFSASGSRHLGHAMPRHGGSPPVAVSLADDRWQWLLATGIWHRQPICERGFGRARRLAAASMVGQCSLSLYFFCVAMSSL